ncbi:histidine kinase sensor domain-containing protein [Bowmanella denitrificans]|uniref:histidine kinase sensor domain-containing protein n=1 Tax=Bowmanella denitrificans TaxID=366582 RepID=UPI000C9BF2BB|nr:histidine kinase sensor domain-containing protein [Bowmanella denitrificans]
MKRTLFWKFFVVLATGTVAFFYLLHILTIKTEENMSFIAEKDKQELQSWGAQAEAFILSKQFDALDAWLTEIKNKENTWLSIASFEALHIAGENFDKDFVGSYHFGRSVDWKIHLYFAENPVMELPFTTLNASLLVKLPERMRPGTYWSTARFVMQIMLPMTVLALLSFVLYRHIMSPLQRLDKATKEFSMGNFEARVGKYLGNRDDELSHLADTFDQMACRIGELIASQRQLISDLSHELRTPLTRLDIAVSGFDNANSQQHLMRIGRESQHIRKLVEDTLTLAWLDNEKPVLQQEQLDLVDLLDVLIEDAKFEFPDRHIHLDSPVNAIVQNSSHRALCLAIENVIRNALRYTPPGKVVHIALNQGQDNFCILVSDQGPGIPEQYLQKVFEPFFRVDDARQGDNHSFGLGLALAKRHLASVRASIHAENRAGGGLQVVIRIPAV